MCPTASWIVPMIRCRSSSVIVSAIASADSRWDAARRSLAASSCRLLARISAVLSATVTGFHEDSLQRPIVRIIRNACGSMLDQPYEVDLKRQLHLMISGFGNAKPVNGDASSKDWEEASEYHRSREFHVV